MADAGGRLGNYRSSLGQLFLINLEQFQRAGRIKADNLLLAGMGEPGRFARDSLQFLISTSSSRSRSWGMMNSPSPARHTAERTHGRRRGSRPRPGNSRRYDRLRAMADDDTKNREALRNVAAQPLSVVIAHRSEQIEGNRGPARRTGAGEPVPNVTLTIHRGPALRRPDHRAEPGRCGAGPAGELSADHTKQIGGGGDAGKSSSRPSAKSRRHTALSIPS